MNISDLSYQETAIEANTLEGGIVSYESGTVFAQRYQYVGALTTSGPTGSIAGGSVIDISTFTAGGLKVLF